MDSWAAKTFIIGLGCKLARAEPAVELATL